MFDTLTSFIILTGADPGFDQERGPQIVTGLKLPFWGLSYVEFWCWGLIFGGQGGWAPRAPLWICPWLTSPNSWFRFRAKQLLQVNRLPSWIVGCSSDSKKKHKNKGNEKLEILICQVSRKIYGHELISLRHSVNGDFCGHSRFVLWHENLTTFVSWTLGLLPNLNPGGGVALIHSKSWP